MFAFFKIIFMLCYSVGSSNRNYGSLENVAGRAGDRCNECLPPSIYCYRGRPIFDKQKTKKEKHKQNHLFEHE